MYDNYPADGSVRIYNKANYEDIHRESKCIQALQDYEIAK